MGVSEGRISGLIVSTAEDTSLTGEVRNGTLNAEIIRAELNHNMKMHELSVNSLTEINYQF